MEKTLFAIVIILLVLGVAGIAAIFWLTQQQHQMDLQDQRAAALLARGQVAEALSVWQELLQQRPKDITLLNRVGIACTQAKDFAKAESFFRRAMEVDAKEPQAYFNLALLYMQKDQTDQAKATLLRLMDIADWYPEANYHLGYIYEKTGQPDLAMKYYIRELNVNGSCAKAWRRLQDLQKDQQVGQK